VRHAGLVSAADARDKSGQEVTNMRRIAVALCATLLAAVCLSSRAGGADESAGETPTELAPLAQFIGEWTIDGHWANGEALKARETAEWGLNRKFIEVRTWVSRNDGSGEYERYRSIYSVKDGKLVLYNFAYDGGSSVDEMKVNGKVIDVRRKAKSPDGGEMVIRQELEFTGSDKFQWRVWLERDGNSQQIMDGQWVRKSAAK
jgi:hypothetical protein